MLKAGTIITCPKCNKHLYKTTKPLIKLVDTFEASDFKELNNMPEPINNALAAPCNSCGTGWLYSLFGVYMHTEYGWWPR